MLKKKLENDAEKNAEKDTEKDVRDRKKLKNIYTAGPELKAVGRGSLSGQSSGPPNAGSGLSCIWAANVSWYSPHAGRRVSSGLELDKFTGISLNFGDERSTVILVDAFGCA